MCSFLVSLSTILKDCEVGTIDTGFPKKDARLSILKKNPDLLIDDREGEIM